MGRQLSRMICRPWLGLSGCSKGLLMACPRSRRGTLGQLRLVPLLQRPIGQEKYPWHCCFSTWGPCLRWGAPAGTEKVSHKTSKAWDELIPEARGDPWWSCRGRAPKIFSSSSEGESPPSDPLSACPYPGLEDFKVSAQNLRPLFWWAPIWKQYSHLGGIPSFF